MNIGDTIRAIQKQLNIYEDGKAGPQTWAAIYSNIVKINGDEVDTRSEKNIATLNPEVQPYARALIYKAKELGIEIKVISGTRTYAEQDELYAIGRTKELDRKPVTKAKGGYSNHNFGIAFDIGIFEGTEYLDESPEYNVVGALGIEIGLDWGGNWKSFKDRPHFQLRPKWAKLLSEDDMLAQLRVRKGNNQDYFV